MNDFVEDKFECFKRGHAQEINLSLAELKFLLNNED